MSSLNMKIPHELSQAEALKRIRGLLDQVKQAQKDNISNLEEKWEGETGNFRFTARGFDISGSIKVRPSSVDIDANVPFAVALFKGMIKQVIDKKARELLSR